MAIQCIYVEKQPAFAVEARATLADLRSSLGLSETALSGLRILNRYLLENIDPADFAMAKTTILAEPPVDDTLETLPDFGSARVFASEYLPGQFDQRADSCAQCISLATGKDRPLVRTARVYRLEGDLSEADFQRIKRYLINPVESREASLEIPETLLVHYPIPTTVDRVAGFIRMDETALAALLKDLGLAMDLDDLRFCQSYFRDDERRDPTLTEIRMIDTYWSDHCRHTTFLTRLEAMEIETEPVQAAYTRYLDLRKELGRDRKPITLMDMATIGARALRAQGKLPDLDESEEINACSVKIQVEVDGKPEDWLLMFKNETHNHPTEIEPFGGAATCLGGAIRDPLSGRSYVYQAMRITGASDPLADPAATLPGKLPQKKIVTTAAAGYASYGNQIGLATGHVHEIYHPGYTAKHMELGAVIGAAPTENVVREVPTPGDVVILLGGRTGRDGCGGATGSSKSHTAASLETCGAEVQKGNPPEERKIQRLFRNREATRLIRRCNDFGAGGVSVSIGELADGVAIDLDKVPKKYEGLDGTELAISESQERMSVVVAAADAEMFIQLAAAENLEAVEVARITREPRLTMDWQGNTIVDLARVFLNSNGAPKTSRARIPAPALPEEDPRPITGEGLTRLMGSLAFCGQKGLVERFDASIGAGTVLMPFGGARQTTPAQTMAAKIPVLAGETTTCSLMSWGFDVDICAASPYHGGQASVIESVAKVVAAGGSRAKCWLTFQEYFERLGDDPVRWGKPAAALLGALEAQMELSCGAIGGKDSMSGSFEGLDVPPTLVSFAVSVGSVDRVVSTEFKQAGSKVYLLQPSYRDGLPIYGELRAILDGVEALTAAGKVRAAWAVGPGGTARAVAAMSFGNRIGFQVVQPLDARSRPGAILLEAEDLPEWADALLGTTTADYRLHLPSGEVVDLEAVEAAWMETLAPVYPVYTRQEGPLPSLTGRDHPPHILRTTQSRIAKPRTVIPVFPGSNCEEDTARAFRRAGGEAEVLVVRNRTPGEISQSVEALAKAIRASQIIALPGGFSGGDEPDGSAKFITSFFRNPAVAEAVNDLLHRRDGLICGICNGFQALVKLGLLPFGEIRELEESSPTLTYNPIGRHQSMLVRTRVVSNRSPWLCGFREGDIFTIPVSHGEGRFIADPVLAEQLLQNGQIATVYVDLAGNPTQDIRHNPNNSVYAIEGILSPDGRVYGKMAHNERYGDGLYKNVPGNTRMDMFRNAVAYYQ